MADEGAGGARRTGRRELALLLLAGAAAVGLVLLASRQQVARVEVIAPRPLPATVTVLSGQALLPAASVLAVTVLASLAAVVATRGALRQVTGLIIVGLGIAIGVSAGSGISAARALTAAGHANLSPANGAGGGLAPGSTTAGSGGGSAGSLAGFPAHVLFAGPAWRVLMLAGAVLIVFVGACVVAMARRLPAMSGRYERSAVPRGDAAPRRAAARSGDRAAAASIWDSLSAGADPTAPTAGPD